MSCRPLGARALILGLLLLGMSALGCGRSAPEASVDDSAEAAPTAPTTARPAEKETPMPDAPVRNPYTLAEQALSRLKDGAPLPGRPDDLVVADDAEVRGLYFQNRGRSIAALIRPAANGQPALWLELERAEGGGFVLTGVRRTAADPDLSVEVEGGG